MVDNPDQIHVDEMNGQYLEAVHGQGTATGEKRNEKTIKTEKAKGSLVEFATAIDL